MLEKYVCNYFSIDNIERGDTDHIILLSQDMYIYKVEVHHFALLQYIFLKLRAIASNFRYVVNLSLNHINQCIIVHHIDHSSVDVMTFI